ncbi:hypothetical protein GBAR_LOCUS3693 [Geodia barretti]|uniref:Uncharacterized protein n=1 Tax=Geodia barretti TaxID=519541 RepID=A0AA35R455_GEOBA|nr:hypothetical protein GBAR_LOCUS3693 [Geodia barretti]
MCSVVTRRKAVGGKESCLTLHNMSSLASSDIHKFLPRFVQQEGRTELHDAAERGDVEADQGLLSTSVNINSRTEDVRLSTSECVVSFLTQFIDCCSTGLCIPTTCRKETLLYW